MLRRVIALRFALLVLGALLTVFSYLQLTQLDVPAADTARAFTRIDSQHATTQHARSSAYRNCRPTARFSLNGETYTATYQGSGSSSACSLAPSDTVTVRYNPADPSSAVIPVVPYDTASSYVYVLLGAAMFFVGLAITLRRVIKRRNRVA